METTYYNPATDRHETAAERAERIRRRADRMVADRAPDRRLRRARATDTRSAVARITAWGAGAILLALLVAPVAAAAVYMVAR